jgi:parallel beta-helix repeat protein
MSKTFAINLIVLVLSILAFGASNLKGVFAQAGPAMNGGPDFTPLSITVNSPSPNQAYNLSFNLIFAVTKPASWFTSGAVLYNYDCQGAVNYVRYNIDGQPSVTIPANDNYTGLSTTPIPSMLNYDFLLQGLSLGLHTITVSAQGEYDYWTGSPDYAYTHNSVIGNSSAITFFVGNGTYNLQPVKAQFQGNVTINADGSINPASAPIQKTGNVYTLTDGITGSIAVNESNIVLNGNGCTLIGQGFTPFGDLSLNGISNVTVKNFIIPSAETYEQVIGIQLTNATHITVTNNTITGFESVQAWNGGTYAAIDIDGSSSNIIAGNNLIYDLFGIILTNTSQNRVIANKVVGDVNFKFLFSTGIYADNASNNLIYHNNFINSTIQAIVVSDSVNAWDSGYPIGGNYWSDYWTKYPDAAEIGNSTLLNFPYVIDSQNKDLYPLQNPFIDTAYTIESAPPAISILSPISKLYNQSTIPLTFILNEQTNWIAYSLDGKQNVTLTGNSAVGNLTNGSHNIVIYVNNTYGNIGSQTVSFAVEKPQTGIFGRTLTYVIIAVPVVVICLIAGLLFFRRHLKTALMKPTVEDRLW